MRLARLILHNYRGFEDVSLDFHPELTVIAGINGSGKTSILDAISELLPNSIQRKYTNAGATNPPRFDKSDCRLGQHSARAALTINIPDLVISSAHFNGSEWLNENNARVIFHQPQLHDGPLPIFPYYQINRHAVDKTPGSTSPKMWHAEKAWEPIYGNATFDDLFLWFREREDLENEERRDTPSHIDHQLEAVRKALEKMLPGYANPRIRRPRFSNGSNESTAAEVPVLTITKDGQELAFNRLSEGERTSASLACDIARRLSIANPKADPLLGDGVVQIDEIDLHLHPQWQAKIIPSLKETFPNIQWVVTTHSPIVLSYVPSECVRLIQDFRLVEKVPLTTGRDPNAVLTDIFETPLRPEDVAKKLTNIADPRVSNEPGKR
jgi:predicted ATP-binding protein involved in virulence